MANSQKPALERAIEAAGGPDKLAKALGAPSPRLALKLAIAQAGGPGALGKELGISGPAISQWDICPAPRVLAVERITGVNRTELRPDFYPPEPASRSA